MVPTVLIVGGDLIFNFGTKKITVKVTTEDNRIIELELEEYIKGVIAAEMPASFRLEALKAQAVAARSYILTRLQGTDKREVSITTDINVDQAWISKQKLLEKRGNLKNWFKISEAVNSTRGIFLTYNGKIATTVYHSASGNITASAKNVWGRKVPYLQPVSSNYEADSPYNHFVQKYSFEDFARRLEIRVSSVTDIEILTRSPSQRVLKLQIGSRIFTGKELRRELGLKSTNFKYQIKDNYIKFITTGNGHGVGMSQYGANGMAEQGYNYLEILKHYYPGIKVRKLNY
ncbi:stage II sporulation protein D [Sporohalobacter salinus]|uniref:stage II sporulation protein D n=1 Tax=Sporohalobacter salinus TaxID=1494606 RepID=UPI001EF8A9F8|nr:stage II sporulation protein D [Sporohalobacter salinus]MBM7622904.1 stage II sporulation protein D [Sporohalobacter salinus]